MKKTVLYDKHLRHGAKIVEFGGYLMPIEYSSISLEHSAVRERCGLFDVSHMGEIVIKGKDANKFVNYLITNYVDPSLKMKMLYALLLYPNGGVVDDLMLYIVDESYYILVVNASNTEKDLEWINSHKKGYDVEVIDESSSYSQLALQGPLAEETLQGYTSYNLKELKALNFLSINVLSREFIVSRSGYTGEDGFEVYGDNNDILELFMELSNNPDVSLCGLGARDTLRFEAAMPLYGHEISEEINPLVAGLGFAVKLDKDFIGRDALVKEKEAGLKKKIVAIEMLERGIPRSGYEVYHEDEKIGEITTGYMIPNSSKAYAFVLMDSDYAVLGNEVSVLIRKNKVKAKIRDKKFLEKKYVR